MGTGRKKIAMKAIEDVNRRRVTFSKRKRGLFDKAAELSALTGCQVTVLTFSSAMKPFLFGPLSLLEQAAAVGNPNSEIPINPVNSSPNFETLAAAAAATDVGCSNSTSPNFETQSTACFGCNYTSPNFENNGGIGYCCNYTSPDFEIQSTAATAYFGFNSASPKFSNCGFGYYCNSTSPNFEIQSTAASANFGFNFANPKFENSDVGYHCNSRSPDFDMRSTSGVRCNLTSPVFENSSVGCKFATESPNLENASFGCCSSNFETPYSSPDFTSPVFKSSSVGFEVSVSDPVSEITRTANAAGCKSTTTTSPNLEVESFGWNSNTSPNFQVESSYTDTSTFNDDDDLLFTEEELTEVGQMLGYDE